MYLINPWWFYLIGIAEGLQSFFFIIGVMGILFSIVFAFVFFDEIQKTNAKFKPIKILSIIFAIMIFIGTLIPNEKTCYSMAIASVATTENLEYAAEAGKNVIDYITEKAIELIEAGE